MNTVLPQTTVPFCAPTRKKGIKPWSGVGQVNTQGRPEHTLTRPVCTNLAAATSRTRTLTLALQGGTHTR